VFPSLFAACVKTQVELLYRRPSSIIRSGANSKKKHITRWMFPNQIARRINTMKHCQPFFSPAYGLSLVPQGCRKIHQILNHFSK
jgi:hypothetical protein